MLHSYVWQIVTRSKWINLTVKKLQTYNFSLLFQQSPSFSLFKAVNKEVFGWFENFLLTIW